ncbi:MAG: amino acid permease [bacterium]
MKLEKQLGLTGVFCIATGAMISSGLFVLPALAYTKAGPAVILSYLLAGILIVPAMFASAELLTAMPKSGGDYFYISRAMGSLPGFLGGLSSWFSLACKSAFALVGIGAFMTLICPDISELQMDLVAAASCIFFMAVNLKGVKIAESFQIGIVFALLGILVLYIVSGGVSVKLHNYSGFFNAGFKNIAGTAGLVFVSFVGLTKVASIAEEVKNPTRNIPLGMILSWAVVVSLYLLAVFVTVGLLKGDNLSGTLTPLSDGAGSYAGTAGVVILAVAAIFAFVSTANAGIMTASRAPLAMSRDKLLPPVFLKLNENGVPFVTIIFTSAVMIFMIFVLDIEGIVKVASTVSIILFALANFALIFMRESKVVNYRPVFRAPLYPYLQIAGIILYGVLLFEMGKVALTATGIFIIAGTLWYFIYPYRFEAKKSALVHVVERIIGRQIKDDTLGAELRDVLRERDDIVEDRFDEIIKKCEILDIEEKMRVEPFLKLISEKFSAPIGISKDELFGKFSEREMISGTIVRSGLAIPHVIVEGKGVFRIILVRAREGIIFSEKQPPVKTLFAIVASADERNFYLRALVAIAEIAQEKDFEQKWLEAKTLHDLRDIILLASRRREEVLR